VGSAPPPYVDTQRVGEYAATGVAIGVAIKEDLQNFITYIENCVGLPVVVGSHPMPTNYITLHSRAGDWNEKLQEYLQPLVDDPQASDRYDSTRPSFLK